MWEIASIRSSKSWHATWTSLLTKMLLLQIPLKSLPMLGCLPVTWTIYSKHLRKFYLRSIPFSLYVLSMRFKSSLKSRISNQNKLNLGWLLLSRFEKLQWQDGWNWFLWALIKCRSINKKYISGKKMRRGKRIWLQIPIIRIRRSLIK